MDSRNPSPASPVQAQAPCQCRCLLPAARVNDAPRTPTRASPEPPTHLSSRSSAVAATQPGGSSGAPARAGGRGVGRKRRDGGACAAASDFGPPSASASRALVHGLGWDGMRARCFGRVQMLLVNRGWSIPRSPCGSRFPVTGSIYKRAGTRERIRGRESARAKGGYNCVRGNHR